MSTVRSFVAEARLSAFALCDVKDVGLLALLRARIRSGELAAIREGGGNSRAANDRSALQARLVREIEAKSLGRLSHHGRQYKLVADVWLSRIPERDSYEVVGHRDAVELLRGMASQVSHGTDNLAGLLRQAAEMLTRDWRPPSEPDGLVLLRRTIAHQSYRSNQEPALTPSQIKKLIEKDWIEIELVGQDDNPYLTHFRLEVANNVVKEGDFQKEAFISLRQIESGTYKLILGKANKAVAARETAVKDQGASLQPTPDAGDETPPSVPLETLQVEACAAEATVEPEENEFSVKVVDEADVPMAEVPMLFLWAGGEQTVPTGGNGFAKCNLAADSAHVSFKSAKSLYDVVNPIWAARAPTPIDKYPAPGDDLIAVTSRPAAIELPDNGPALNPVPLDPGKSKTFSVRPAKKRAVYLELHDTLFRNDSAVVNPEGEAPATQVGEHESITSVGLVATVLRYNQEHEGKRLFIAGHTDRAGGESDNVNLSNLRGKAVLALIEGDKGAFVEACKAKHSEVDVTQLMDWVHNQYGFTCKPTVMDRAPSDENYYRFRTSYNKWVRGTLDKDEMGPRGTAIGDTGRLSPDIWEAMFDLYEHNLRQELGEDSAGVAELRKAIAWVDSNKKYVGYGEKHPTMPGTADSTRRDADRRVEVMFFDEQEAPNLAATQGDDIYDSGPLRRRPSAPDVERAEGLADQRGNRLRQSVDRRRLPGAGGCRVPGRVRAAAGGR
jgi:outer membrane protein OmpA-like peptidoglycan-associated protein